MSINDFAVDPKPELRRIASALRSGRFKFSNLRPSLIPKTNGKDRLICVPTVRDRVVQRALLNFLTDKYVSRLSNAISYGFIRYRKVEDAAMLACTHRQTKQWAFKTDITSFFDQVPRDHLAHALRRIVRQRSLHAILMEASACEIEPPQSRGDANRIAKLGIKVGQGIRQGMPLSPFFANVLLDQFDKSIIDKGYTAIRYADDLIFFAPSERECHEIHSFCKSELCKLGLSIPEISSESKSRIYAPGEAAEFLGLGLCLEQGLYVLRLMPEQIAKIRKELESLKSIPELLARKITLSKLATQIQSRTAGYFNAYEMCTNVTELDKTLEDVGQHILRSIYRDGLGINLERISAPARKFLGLI